MASSQTGATHGSPGNNNNPSGERGREKGEEKRREKGESRDETPLIILRMHPELRNVEECRPRLRWLLLLASRPALAESKYAPPLLPDFSRQRKFRVFLSRFSKPGEKYIASKEGKTHGYARKLRGGMKKKKRNNAFHLPAAFLHFAHLARPLPELTFSSLGWWKGLKSIFVG